MTSLDIWVVGFGAMALLVAVVLLYLDIKKK